MKKHRILIVAMALGLLAGGPFASAQTTAFTYQGKLEDSGRAATGLYEMDIALFDVPNGGTALSGAATHLLTPVTNGLFAVTLDFGHRPFDGNARWLEVCVRTNGATTTPIPLLPRTLLGSTPHAIYAMKAGSVADHSIKAEQLAGGAVVKSLNGLKDDVVLAASGNVTLFTNGNTLIIGATGSGALSLPYASGASSPNPLLAINNTGAGSAIAVNSASADGLVGTTASSVSQTAGIRGVASSASGIVVGLYGEAVASPDGTGIVGYGGATGGYFTSKQPGGRAGVFDGNVSVNGTLTASSLNVHSLSIPGGFGSRANQGEFIVNDYFTAIGPYNLPPRFIVKQEGNVGIGVSNPTEKLQVHGAFLRVDGAGGEAAYLGGDGAGNDVQLGSLNSTVQKVVIYNAANNSLMSLIAKEATVAGDLHTTSDAHGLGYRNSINNGFVDGPFLYGYNGGALGTTQPDDVALSWNWQGDVSVQRNLSTCSLTIRGGCDLAEPFPMKEENIDKGSVVIIDDEHPGRLKQSAQAYDTRVAGIVSGAGGVKAGIALHQEGILEGGQNVALTGRVYVKADASFGAIKPGDLLTTSSTPGHAMKVLESGKAQGAILGKAMSSLEAGTGMVLVLVTLQ